MKGTNLAVVCSASGLPQNTELACQAVWAKTTQFLQPNLGKLYSSFYPATNPWGINLNVRFGVLLGREAPEQFVRILCAATEAQNLSIDFHTEALLNRVKPEQTRQVGDTIVCPVTLDGTDKELEAHSIWHMAIAAGAFMPDCGIYYLEQGLAVAAPELRKEIARSIGNYAVCVVRLEAMV